MIAALYNNNADYKMTVKDLKRLLKGLPDDYKVEYHSLCGHRYCLNLAVQDTTKKLLIFKER